MRYFCVAAGILLVSAFALADEAPHVEVLYISGSPQVCLNDQEEYTDAEEGMYLEAGDKIKTDSSSSIELGFDADEENILKVDSNSYAELILKDDSKIELLKGRVFATLNKLSPGAIFEIRTPIAVAGARGTDWSIKVDEDNADIEVFEGNSYIRNFTEEGKLTEAETIISAGYKTQVERFRPPLQARVIPLQDRKGWENLKATIRGNAQRTRIKRRLIPRELRRRIIRKELRDRLGDNPKSSKRPLLPKR